MANKPAYLIAISMTAISVGIWWLYWRNPGQPQAGVASFEQTAQDRAAANSNSQERPRSFPSEEAGSSEVAGHREAAGPGADANVQLNRAPSTTHSSEVNPGSEMDGLSVPEGAAFPISESTEAECVDLEKKNIGCAEVREVLKKIEEERTDPHWAPLMENRVRAAFGVVPGLRIRALSCRSSVCAVEVAGPRVLWPVWEPLESDLLQEDKIYAFEDFDNGAGERILVSLVVFTRRR